MSVLLAFISLAFLALSTFFSEGSSRYFEVSAKAGKAPFTITLNASNLDKAKQAEKFIWDFGNGESLTTTKPIVQYTYQSAGAFTLKLRYLKKEKDNFSKAKDGGQVKIVVSPKPNILPVPQLSCVSNEINKLVCDSTGSTDSDGKITTYKFDWGDNTTNDFTSAGVASHQYLSAGEKTIRLTVTDNKGGIAFVENSLTLKVNTAPVALFDCTKTGIQSIHCESTSTDNEETLSQFNWTLDDGTTYSTANFNHKFSRQQDVAIATHNIQLQVTDSLGLTSTTSQNVAVDLEVIKESPRGYFKVFEMGTTLELHSFIAKTQFAPKRAFYQIYGANEQELLQTIELSEFYPNTVVKADIGTFRNGRIFLTIIDWRDQVFKTSIPFSLVEDTTKLKPFVEFRSIQSALRTVYLNLNPSFDFDLDFAIKSFIINFGDGQQVELSNDTFLTHTYAAAGTYLVSVTATTNHNTQATLTRSVTVTDNDLPAVTPDATFGYRIFSYAQNVSFYNEKSGTPNGEIISYMWDFGDGSTGTGATQSHFYEPGTYLVSLTVTDTAGLTNTQTQKVTIKADGADLLAGIDCSLQLPYLDYTQKCKVLALDRFNQISRVRVLWGDGTVSVLGTPFDANQGIYFPSKKYTTAGLYSVKVVVNTTRGDVAGFETSLNIVARPPIASIQCYPNNLAVYCDALGSYDPKGSQLSYEFNFGNGHIETNQTGVISYAYPEAGLYDVSVKVTDAQGMSGTSTTKVQAVRPPNQLPVANFNCDSPQPYTMFCWEDGIYDPDGTITIKKLSYDDGDYGFLNSNETTRHQFTTSGQHEVTLTVMDNDGGVTTVTKVIEVKKNNPPVANFECNSYGPQKLNCYSTSTDPDQDDFPIKYEWSFGDGNTQNGVAGWFEHQYPSSQGYIIKLTVHDKYGATSTVEKEATPLENILPSIAINCDSNKPFEVNCYLNVSDQDGHIVDKKWYLDDELTSFTDYQITKIFSESRDVIVRAQVTDDLGGVSSATTTIHAKENQLPFVDGQCTSEFAQGLSCVSWSYDPDNVGDLNVEWQINDIKLEGAIVSTTLNSSGMNSVLLKVTDFHGGVSTKLIPVLIKDNLLPIAIAECTLTKDASLFCNSNSYDPDGQGLAQIKWILNNGTIFFGESFTYKLNGESEIVFDLVVRDTLGGISFLNKKIPVNVPPPPVIPPVAESCPVSENLKNKICSQEYFKPANSGELTDYLQNGKYIDNKLLNLEIDSNLKLTSDVEISISTSCNLKISHNADVKIINQNVCFGANNIEINNGNISTENRGDIKIISNKTITISGANILSADEIAFRTNTFEPYNGGIFISSSLLEGSSTIRSITKSNFEIADDTILNSNVLEFSAGRCKIGNRQSIGNCSLDAYPNANIAIVKNDSPKEIFASVSGLEGQYSQILWRANEIPLDSSTDTINVKFETAGIHEVDVVVINNDGQFKKIKAPLSIAMGPLKKFEVNILYFANLKSQDIDLKAYIGEEEVLVIRSKINPRYLSIMYDGDLVSNKLLTIPAIHYSEEIEIMATPVFMDPESFLTSKLDEINTIVQSSGEDFPELKNNIATLILDFKANLSQMSFEEKLEAAQVLHATQSSFDLVAASLNKPDTNLHFSFFNLIIPSAHADEIPKSDNNSISKIGKFIIAGGSLIILYELSTLSSEQLKGKWTSRVAKSAKIARFGALIIGTVAVIYMAYKLYKQSQELISDLRMPSMNNIMSNLNSRFVSETPQSLIFSTTLIPVAENLNNSVIYRSVYSLAEKLKAQITNLNDSVKELNILIAEIGFSSIIVPKLNNADFPLNTIPGLLSGNFIKKIDIISSEKGNVEVSNVEKLDDLKFKIKSQKSQKIKLKFFYENLFLDLSGTFEKDVEIIVKPKAVINYTSDKLVVNFDSTDPQDPDATSLIYLWNFGDGQSKTTTNKHVTHTYSEIGTFNISLTVTDSYGESNSTQKTILVPSSAIAFCNVDTRGVAFTFNILGAQVNKSFTLNNPRTDDYINNPIDCECKIVDLKPLQPSQTYHVTVTSTDIACLTTPNGVCKPYPIQPFSEDIVINAVLNPFIFKYNFDATPSLPYGTFSVTRGVTASHCRSLIYK